MSGPLLEFVPVLCEKCRRAQIRRIENGVVPEQPCWWCRHNLVLPQTVVEAPRALDRAAIIPKS